MRTPNHLIRRLARTYAVHASPSVIPAYLRLRTIPAPRVPAVDSHCVPLVAPYSLADLLPSKGSQEQLSSKQKSKLYAMANLSEPSAEEMNDPERWAGLERMIGLMSSITSLDLGAAASSSSAAGGAGKMVDARVRSTVDEEPIDLFSEVFELEMSRTKQGREDGYGLQFLELAKDTEAGFYVAQTPRGVRTKKRSAEGVRAWGR